MIELHLLPNDERELFFRAATDIISIPFEVIEKDYWVVWTLERLFSIEDIKPYLTFKGGTSLSKVYGIIDRFSEDIDLSIEKKMFGFDTFFPEDMSSKKKKKMLDALSKTCSHYVQKELLTQLKETISNRLKTTKGWDVFIDMEDPDAQTLLFEYPSNASKSGYIRPIVKIEVGARSEHWPVSEHKIQSYTKNSLKERIYEPEIWIRVLNAERTFWEKATILHQYTHLPEGKKLPPRISRHFYDFFCLLNSKIKEKALSDTSLLEHVANHKNTYFASSWARYETARKGTLKLSPPSRILKELEKDYTLMKAMFFREIPNWSLILETIAHFEQEFNNPDA